MCDKGLGPVNICPRVQSWRHVLSDVTDIATVHFPEHLVSDVLLVVTTNH